MNKTLIFFFSLLACCAVIVACEKDNEDDEVYAKTGLPMNTAQEVPQPVVPSSATGTIDASYSKSTKTLTYKVTWQGLTSDSIRGMHIHGIAGPGFAAPILQNFTGYPLKASGSYSGTLFADGTVIKEEDILANQFYVNIHTKANPAGEIRGQLTIN